MVEAQLILKGAKITQIYTIGSWYNNNCIVLVDDENNKYRMNVEELLKIVNDLEFTTEKKKVHTYLSIVNFPESVLKH